MEKSRCSTRNYDLSTLLKPYENQWVALSPDDTTVVASGETLKEAHANVPQGERETVIFHKVLPFDAFSIPTFMREVIYPDKHL